VREGAQVKPMTASQVAESATEAAKQAEAGHASQGETKHGKE
jgi:hypothetical protein